MLNRIINFFWFFLYVSNIQFTFLPDKIRTRLIVGLIGICYYFFCFKGYDFYRIGIVIRKIIPLAVCMGLSMLMNMSTQYWFLQYVILQIIYMFGAVFVIHTTKISKLTTLLWYFLIYVCVQDIVAMASFISPMIFELMKSINVSELSADRIQLFEQRSLGFGEFCLFGGGIWIAIGVLCMTVLCKMQRIKLPLYFVFLAMLLGTGLFVARTSLTGVLAIAILFIPFVRYWYRVVYVVLWGW